MTWKTSRSAFSYYNMILVRRTCPVLPRSHVPSLCKSCWIMTQKGCDLAWCGLTMTHMRDIGADTLTSGDPLRLMRDLLGTTCNQLRCGQWRTTESCCDIYVLIMKPNSQKREVCIRRPVIQLRMCKIAYIEKIYQNYQLWLDIIYMLLSSTYEEQRSAVPFLWAERHNPSKQNRSRTRTTLN